MRYLQAVVVRNSKGYEAQKLLAIVDYDEVEAAYTMINYSSCGKTAHSGVEDMYYDFNTSYKCQIPDDLGTIPQALRYLTYAPDREMIFYILTKASRGTAFTFLNLLSSEVQAETFKQLNITIPSLGNDGTKLYSTHARAWLLAKKVLPYNWFKIMPLHHIENVLKDVIDVFEDKSDIILDICNTYFRPILGLLDLKYRKFDYGKAYNCGANHRIVRLIHDTYILGCFEGTLEEAKEAINEKYSADAAIAYIQKLETLKDNTKQVYGEVHSYDSGETEIKPCKAISVLADPSCIPVEDEFWAVNFRRIITKTSPTQMVASMPDGLVHASLTAILMRWRDDKELIRHLRERLNEMSVSSIDVLNLLSSKWVKCTPSLYNILATKLDVV